MTPLLSLDSRFLFSGCGLSILLSMVFALVNLLLFDRTTGCANLALPPLSLKRKNSSEWLRGSTDGISVSTWPWSSGEVAVMWALFIQFLFQPRILSLTEEKDFYLGCLAMTKKPTCDNSTLEALMRLFLPAHDHKLSLLISLLSYPRMAWYALAGPSPLLVSLAADQWPIYRIMIFFLFLQTNKTVLIPMYSISMTWSLPFLFYCIWPLVQSFFRHSN